MALIGVTRTDAQSLEITAELCSDRSATHHEPSEQPERWVTKQQLADHPAVTRRWIESQQQVGPPPAHRRHEPLPHLPSRDLAKRTLRLGSKKPLDQTANAPTKAPTSFEPVRPHARAFAPIRRQLSYRRSRQEVEQRANKTLLAPGLAARREAGRKPDPRP